MAGGGKFGKGKGEKKRNLQKGNFDRESLKQKYCINPLS